MNTASFLRQVSLFVSLTDQQVEALGSVTLTRLFPRDSVIILAEEEGDTLFLVKRGRVKVNILSEEGREVILSLLGTGSVFGELSLLDGKPLSANVIAVEDTELIMLRRPDFLKLIHQTPQIATALLAELASRLRKTDRQIEGLALLDVTSRISDTLLQLAGEQGVENDAGVILKRRPTHQELANMSGTTRETVSRVLKRLEYQGYIACRGRELTILREENWSRSV